MTEAMNMQAAYDELINRAFAILETCSKDIAASHIQNGIAADFMALHARQMRPTLMKHLGIDIKVNEVNARLDAWLGLGDDSLEYSELPAAMQKHMEAWISVLELFYAFDIEASKESMRRALATMAKGRATLAQLGIV